MPELKVIHIAIIAVMTVVGTIVGWVLRGKHSHDEKAAVSAGWQERISAQRSGHDRLTDQNKVLMEKINQYQASNKDAKNRARELSDAVQEAFARRDELQREIKDIRDNLEVALHERDQLQSDISANNGNSTNAAQKDARIRKLRLELQNWHDRLPPLVERYRQRNQDAERLETELNDANARIAELESLTQVAQTRIEPVSDPDMPGDGRSASNDPIDEMEYDPIDAVLEEPVDGSGDNLQAIKGVGPTIEKTLNAMGVFRFQQIANMSEYEIDRIANRLKGLRSRIYREDWIGQARDLCDQESGD